jgi:hypothetical protein
MGATAFAADFEVPAVPVVEDALAAALALRARKELTAVKDGEKTETHQPCG